jgi:hypothetical protein
VLAILLILGVLLIMVFIVFITNAERRIPVQYAKRVVGRKVYGGQNTHPAHQGQYVRRSADHLRAVHRFSSRDHRLRLPDMSGSSFWTWMNTYVFEQHLCCLPACSISC